MGIIAVILGLTMSITPTMIASIVMCILSIIFIVFSGYNLIYHSNTLKSNPLSSESSPSGGYYYYKE